MLLKYIMKMIYLLEYSGLNGFHKLSNNIVKS